MNKGVKHFINPRKRRYSVIRANPKAEEKTKSSSLFSKLIPNFESNFLPKEAAIKNIMISNKILDKTEAINLTISF